MITFTVYVVTKNHLLSGETRNYCNFTSTKLFKLRSY